MSNFVVTGGAGFIGSNIAKSLIEKGHKVKVFDNFSSGSLENLKPVLNDVEIVNGDIRDIETLNEAFMYADYVFHEAAIASVQASIENPVETGENNVTGTVNVLMSARDNGIKRVVFASSAAVYGDSQELPKNEDMMPDPLSPYALHKLSGEYYLKMFNRLYGLETVSLRYFNVFGPGQNPSSPYSGVISIFVDKVLKGETPRIYGDGLQTRDFVYVENVVDANIKAMFSDKVGRGDVINIATGKASTLNELFSIICKLQNKDIEAVYEPPRQGDIRHSRASIRKAQELLDYKVGVDLQNGLERLIDSL